MNLRTQNHDDIPYLPDFLAPRHFRKPVRPQHPEGVEIPPLTPEQYAALKNWNVAAQVGIYGVTTGITTMVGAAAGTEIGGPAGISTGGVLGAMAGVMWGTYEVSCLQSVQGEFDKAQEEGGGVQVWREGFWSFGVYGGGDTYTEANGPLSATYVAITTWVLTGNIP